MPEAWWLRYCSDEVVRRRVVEGGPAPKPLTSSPSARAQRPLAGRYTVQPARATPHPAESRSLRRWKTWPWDRGPRIVRDRPASKRLSHAHGISHWPTEVEDGGRATGEGDHHHERFPSRRPTDTGLPGGVRKRLRKSGDYPLRPRLPTDCSAESHQNRRDREGGDVYHRAQD